MLDRSLDATSAAELAAEAFLYHYPLACQPVTSTKSASHGEAANEGAPRTFAEGADASTTT
jgi:hypothetical protein